MRFRSFRAQTSPVRGKIELKKTDGTTVPVADAVVEPFRTDAKGKSPSAKTNKKGEFSFAGLQVGQIFVLSVSAPNIKPALLPNVKAGMENLTYVEMRRQALDGSGIDAGFSVIPLPQPGSSLLRKIKKKN